MAFLVAVGASLAARRLTDRGAAVRLGALTLAAGVVAGSSLAEHIPSGVGPTLVVVAGLAAVGPWLEQRTRRGVLWLLPAAVAVAAAAGVRADAGGDDLAGSAVAAAWLLAASLVTMATGPDDRVVDVMGTMAAGGVAGVSLLGGQEGVAAVAAALAGAQLGRLAVSRRTRAPLGRAGRAIPGLLVVALAIEGQPGEGVGTVGVSVALLLAVPLLDVAASRGGALRRGGPPARHLLSRLVARSASPRRAWAGLLLANASLVGAAVMAARGMLGQGTAISMAALPLGAVLVAARAWRPRPVRGERRAPWPRWAVGAGLAVGGLVLTVPAAIALVLARAEAADAVTLARRGLQAARRGEVEMAERAFAQAAAGFEQADRVLRGPLPTLGLAVPVLSSNLDAARTLAGMGGDLARAGERLATTANPRQIRIRDGRVPLEEVRELAPELDRVASDLDGALATARRLEREPGLLPPVRRLVDDARSRLLEADEGVDRAAEAARLLPDLMGAQEPRRYFLAVQNSAEARATGGLIGSFGELVADDGTLRLERFGRIRALNREGAGKPLPAAPREYVERYGRFRVAETWQNVNLSPDFPTVGEVISGLYPQSGGQEVDGVIAIDPRGLAALLRIVGPVRVPDWPEPINARNVVDVTLRRAYERLDKPERVEFSGDVAVAVTEKFASTTLDDPAGMLEALGDAVRGGHIVVYLKAAVEQDLVRDLGADGAVPDVRVDSLLVVNQNAAPNKVDFYLRREIGYRATIVPGRDGALVRGTITVTLTNDAPGEGLPSYVIGPNAPGRAPGENYSYMSVYTPHVVTGAAVDGDPLNLETGREFDRQVYSAYVSVPAGASRTVTLEFTGWVALLPGGWYELDMLRQPLLTPDTFAVSLAVGPGWSVIEAADFDRGGGTATASGDLEEPRTLRVRFGPSGA